MKLRSASVNDLEAIRLIYNKATLKSTVTFDTKEKSFEDILQWFNNRSVDFPVIVSEINGLVVGYEALNK